MKRFVIHFTLSILLLFSAITVLANEQEPFPEISCEDNLELTCAIGAPEGDVYIERYLADIFLNNYDEIEEYYGEDPRWDLYALDDEEFSRYAYIDVHEDNRGVAIMANTDEMPEEDLSAHYDLALLVGEQLLITRTIHIDFVSAEMPEGIDIGDREYNLTVGDTIEIHGAFLPESYEPRFEEEGHINVGINDFPGDLEEFLQIECKGKTSSITALQPGTYVLWVDMVDGNIVATTRETVILKVGDGEGHVPALDPVFDSDTYNMTMSLEPENARDFNYWVSEGDELFLRPVNEEQLTGLYGDEDPVWSFETITPGVEVDMYTERTDDSFDMRIANLNDMVPDTSAEVKATLNWGEGSTEIWISIDFIRMELPEAVDWQDLIELESGETTFGEVIVTPDGWNEGFLFYDISHYEEHFEKWHDEENSFRQYIKGYRPGTYYGSCHIHAHNVFIWGPSVTYKVLYDGETMVPDLALEHGELEYTAAAAPQGEGGQGLWIDPFIGDFRIDHADKMKEEFPDVFEEDPVWTVEPINDTAIGAKIIENWGDDWAQVGVFVDHIPKETTDSYYLVTCEWGGKTESREMCIHYRADLPMPEGSNIPEVVYLSEGESYDWYGDFEPEEYDFYERSYCNTWPHEEEDAEVERLGDRAVRITPKRSGIIWMYTEVVSSNIVFSKDIRLVVENDITVLEIPGNLERIEDEAFKGCIEYIVEVPDTCNYIGHEAFSDNPNLVEVRVQNGIEIEEDAFDENNYPVISWR